MQQGSAPGPGLLIASCYPDNDAYCLGDTDGVCVRAVELSLIRGRHVLETANQVASIDPGLTRVMPSWKYGDNFMICLWPRGTPYNPDRTRSLDRYLSVPPVYEVPRLARVLIMDSCVEVNIVRWTRSGGISLTGNSSLSHRFLYAATRPPNSKFESEAGKLLSVRITGLMLTTRIYLPSLLKAITAFDTSKSSTMFPKHFSQVFDNCVGSLPRRKMSSGIILAGQNKRSHALVPQLGKLHELLWKLRRPKFDIRNEPVHLCTVSVRIMLSFVVCAKCSGRTGGTEPVNRDPGQDLIVFPWVVISPAGNSQTAFSFISNTLLTRAISRTPKKANRQDYQRASIPASAASLSVLASSQFLLP
jgi:hypothetical protein